jgi:two-component system response regulator RegA
VESWPKAARTPKILIVDTDPLPRLQLAAALRREGCDVVEATTFEEGKRLWTSERPAMLIADIRLGQFNGLQLLLRATAEREDVKAIITSAVADRVLEAETRRFGGVFRIKPVAASDVVAFLRSATAVLPTSFDRRVAERRQLTIPSFAPDRRSTERRRLI